MPHIIVEYSSNIEDQVNIPEMLESMHTSLADGGIDKAKIKTRGVSIPHSMVGNNAHNMGYMIHITLLLLEGREIELKKQYSTPLYDIAISAVKQHFPDCSFSLEVRDMFAATYIL
jgi:5-carboxymethyl-2-hydroxymuconate isomerase